MKAGYFIVALLAVTPLSGCASRMIPVSGTDEPSVSITVAVGDSVRVLTKHGERPTYMVTDITKEALIGADQQIRFEDMAFVEKRVRGQAADGQPGALAVVLMVVASTVSVREFKRLGPGFQDGY